MTLLYRTTLSDGHPGERQGLKISSLQIDTPVIEAELTIPGSRRLPVSMPAGGGIARLPARIDRWGRVIVRLTVSGRGLDFQLDSGASAIIFDRDVVRQLGLKTHGRWSTTVAGTFISGRAIIPKIAIGDVTMSDVVVEAAAVLRASSTSARGWWVCSASTSSPGVW